MIGTGLSLLLAVIKIIGAIIDRLDESSKTKARDALLEAGRMKVENDVREKAVAAYAAALADPGVVQRERDKPDSGYFRD